MAEIQDMIDRLDYQIKLLEKQNTLLEKQAELTAKQNDMMRCLIGIVAEMGKEAASGCHYDCLIKILATHEDLLRQGDWH